MQKQVEIRISHDFIDNKKAIESRLAKQLGIPYNRISHSQLIRRSIDARKKPPVYLLRYELWVDEKPSALPPFEPHLQNVNNCPPVLIVGFGPAGMFAALKAIELGYKPVILERGKAVRERRRDLAVLNREGIVNPESNYCFGEGGAGTFSDGKLYTRSKKRGNIERILQLLVHFGAPEDILIDAHPHIGTNKLPQLIQNIREQIIDCGGEILFDTKVTELLFEGNGGNSQADQRNNTENEGKENAKGSTGQDKDKSRSKRKIAGVKTAKGETIRANAVILATGHSARDIFEMLDRQGVEIEAKGFALGVRVEHPQSLIDQSRYRCGPTRPDSLPAASYNLVQQVGERGVYSFCMCPGGIICPAATANDELVVNGWSPSKRNSPYANSGMVVEIRLEDLPNYAKQGIFSYESPVFAAMEFQKAIETAAYTAGGGKQIAPAQRLTDFVKGKFSQSLPDCSYIPGVNSVNMAEVLPPPILERLQGGFKAFGKKIRGYLSDEALVVAPESRTSSPVRIPRDRDSLMHPGVEGLYPCGEGAGYAGGIMSAALDGERCMEASVVWL